ncbi:MAG: response regulator [Anaerolineales bacterium]
MIKKLENLNSLLITNSTDQNMNKVIRDTLQDMGSLQIFHSDETLIAYDTYDLVIIDAGSVADPTKSVTKIHAEDPKVKIIVVSASPHWKVAKATIRAGAADYLSKCLTKDEITEALQKIFKESITAMR